MRWSFIIVGQMRSLRHRVVQLHMQSMNLRVINPDIYAHISPLFYSSLHSESPTTPVPELLNSYVVYWNVSILEEDMKRDRFNGHPSRVSPHPLCNVDYQETILRGVLQRWFICMQNMLRHERRTRMHYDYVLRARPDLHYSLSFLPHLLSPTTAVITESDLFWIAPRRVAIHLLNVKACKYRSCNHHMACMDDIAHMHRVVIHEPCPHIFGKNRTLSFVPCVSYATIWRDRNDAELKAYEHISK